MSKARSNVMSVGESKRERADEENMTATVKVTMPPRRKREIKEAAAKVGYEMAEFGRLAFDNLMAMGAETERELRELKTGVFASENERQQLFNAVFYRALEHLKSDTGGDIFISLFRALKEELNSVIIIDEVENYLHITGSIPLSFQEFVPELMRDGRLLPRTTDDLLGSSTTPA